MTILGASFDTPEDNQTFAVNNEFPFRLLSDPDRTAGAAYGTARDPGDDHPEYALRITFLLDPDLTIRKVYEVTDRAGHAGEVLADLESLGVTA